MALNTRVSALATRVGQECKALWTAVNGKAAAVHSHDDLYFTETESDAKYHRAHGANAAGTDLNSYVANGTFRIDALGINMPAGAYTYGYLVVTQGIDSNNVIQRYYPDQGTIPLWTRVRWSGIWRAWRAVPDSTHGHALTDANITGVLPNAQHRAPIQESPAGPTNNDMNQTIHTGWYMSSNAANAPTTGWWWYEVIRHNDVWTHQHAYRFTNGVTAHEQYVRKQENGVWGAWTRTGYTVEQNDARHHNVDHTPAALWRAVGGVTGGGTISVSSGGLLNWTTRFIVISHGRGAHFSTSGYFDINRPPDGTVIPGVGGAANHTVAGGVVLNVWQALYYILPVGGVSASVPANFRLVNYTSDVIIPDNWLLIAVRNGDASGPVRVCTGQHISLGGTSTGDNPYPQYAISNVTRVVYTTTVPARPAGATYVEWVGNVDPGANALAGDTWVPTT